MGFMDWVHGGLDVAGMVPIVGNAADLANAGLYAVRGDALNAGISLAGCIPGAGQAATGARLAAKAGKKILKEVGEEAVEQGAKQAAKKGAKKKAAGEATEEAAEGTAKNGTTVTKGGGGGGGGGGGKGKNKLQPDRNNAQGDHTVFKRDDNGNIYKYETYEKTSSGHFNPTKRFDGGKPDGSPGAPHVNKITQESIPTPHINGKNIPGGVRKPTPSEIPNNPRFRSD